MKTTMRLAAVVLAAAPMMVAADDIGGAVATYRAIYQAEYKGKSLGTSQFSVSYDGAREIYRFESQTTAKGLLKLAMPNPVIERSDFRVHEGAVQPLEFWYEDGSRKGEDNLHIVFDWDNSVAVVVGQAGRSELRLEAGALDRGSMQVALMRDLAGSGQPGRYLLLDDDSLKPYEYSASGELTVTTGVGDLQTLAFVQQRENSSRSTHLWVAPQLQYLPVRIEQHRNGEIRTAFTLESVEGLTPQAP